MKKSICEFEQSVIRNLSASNRSGELSAHLKQCADCREALKVAQWMQTFAASAAKEANALPAPGFLWWKSKLIERQEAAKRAARPIVWTQIAAALIFTATIFWLLIENQAHLAPVWNNLSTSLELITVPLLIAFICGALICLTLALKWRSNID